MWDIFKFILLIFLVSLLISVWKYSNLPPAYEWPEAPVKTWKPSVDPKVYQDYSYPQK